MRKFIVPTSGGMTFRRSASAASPLTNEIFSRVPASMNGDTIFHRPQKMPGAFRNHSCARRSG